MSLDVETQSDIMPHSMTSSVTHVAVIDTPEDKVKEALKNLEDDWEKDPDNARNWSFGRKWTTIGIVSFYIPCFLI